MKSNGLAPIQGALFERLDSPLHGKLRSERSVMDFPLFALSKKAQMEPMRYDRDGISIQIRPSASGIATMYDKEILIYVSSMVAKKMADTGQVESVFVFNTHDFFRVTGVNRPSRRDYNRFSEALARLQGTQIQTNIKTGNMGTRGFFSWFAEAHSNTRAMPDGSEQLLAVKVHLCEWLVRAITRDSRMYNYHHDYFRLGSIERRLYELAHCLCDNDAAELALEDLAARIGTTSSLRLLKSHLKRIQSDNRMPEFEIEVCDVVPAAPNLDRLGRKIGKPSTVVVLKPRAKSIASITGQAA